MNNRVFAAGCLGLGLLAAAVPLHTSAGIRGGAGPHPADSVPGQDERLSARARAQLAEARRATEALRTPEAAMAAGYALMFGNVPLQGEHYVRIDLVQAGRFDVRRPSVLMFAAVAGKPTLVGVAYAILHPSGAPMPDGFDGTADEWHAHDDLADVPGKRLVMTHAWFASSPEGAFARYNPALPFLAAGMTPPSAPELRDPARADRVRRLGRALALAGELPPELAALERSAPGELLGRLQAHREGIRALVPRLREAEAAGDEAHYAHLVAEAVGHSEAMIALYREAAPHAGARRDLDRVLAQFLAGEHHAHGDHAH
ncbi:MAG TPA: hypothetical protein VHG08_20645 [Longimicrobium sp.]|nr:hypothetical protein [Longimicrobium sp.]